MGKIPEEAVKAAKDVLYYASPNDVERALAAAAPFLQGVKVKADPWVDTRLVSFDDTIAFGKGGFDFDRWESLRWEMHTRHGSFAVWKSDSKTWSMYGGKYGFLMLDRFSSEEEAKAEAEQLVISLDAEPSTRAQAARIKDLEHSERVKGVNTQYANALANLGMTEDDEAEPFADTIIEKLEALEAKLAAAEKALENAADDFYLIHTRISDGQVERAKGTALAGEKATLKVLGGKPS